MKKSVNLIEYKQTWKNIERTTLKRSDLHGVVFAGIAPHPPLLIPEVGRGELRKVAKTAKAMRELGHRVSESGAELVVIITPHGPVSRDEITVIGEETVEGDFGRFGAANVELSFQVDGELCRYVVEEAAHAGVGVKVLPGGEHPEVEMDHGAGVPLHFLRGQEVDIPGLIITPGFLPYDKLFLFGKALRKAVARRGLKTALIASGDLSHRLKPGAPAGYDPRGEEFDEQLINYLSAYRVEDILNMDPHLIEAAGECGLGPIITALGFLFGLKVTPEIMSYEAPFGVGYLVASLNTDGSFHDLDNVVTGIARESIEGQLKKGKKASYKEDIPPEFAVQKGGAFVSLKKRGHLRGCIGTVEPVYDNLIDEIKNNAVSAGFKDPRFPPLQRRELEEVSVSVDVLSPMEEVSDLSELDPKKYGIMVRSGNQSGLLLPDLEGVDTVEEQLDITLKKAGISPDDSYRIYRFTVTRYGE